MGAGTGTMAMIEEEEADVVVVAVRLEVVFEEDVGLAAVTVGVMTTVAVELMAPSEVSFHSISVIYSPPHFPTRTSKV